MTDLLRELIEHAADFSEPTVTAGTFGDRLWLPNNMDDDGS
jgi:hypothetical protein